MHLSFRRLIVPAFCLSAVCLSQPAMALSTASIQATLSIVLIDLNPNDAVLPAISFSGANANSVAGFVSVVHLPYVSTTVYSDKVDNSAWPGQTFHDKSIAFQNAQASVAASVNGNEASVTGPHLFNAASQSQALSPQVDYISSGTIGMDGFFDVSPQTLVLFQFGVTGNLTASGSYGNFNQTQGGPRDTASLGARMDVTGPASSGLPGGQQSSQMSVGLNLDSHIYHYLGSGEYLYTPSGDHSKSLSTSTFVSFTNRSDSLMTGRIYGSVSASTRSSSDVTLPAPVVPEPGTVALVLTGLGVVACASRRATRA